MTADVFGQHAYQIRLEWGADGAQALAGDIAVVVDVLSFSTSVCIAVERGMSVYPYVWKDQRAKVFAEQHDAVLALGRLEAAKPGMYSAPTLSPAHLLECESFPRLVLPSPNGSTISAGLYESGTTVLLGCLRNAESVAEWLSARVDEGEAVGIVPAGERWGHNDSMRPALEDHLGAGAIVSGLIRRGHEAVMSPEAIAAARLFDSVEGSLAVSLRDCVGARELASMGFSSDVEAAEALNVSQVVPVLNEGCFVPAASVKRSLRI